MSSTLTFPGVYIEELPSAVRTIVGVSTAVTAFVGTAQRGPTDGPRHLTSWSDFERTFGGLSTASPMSYAVLQFFQNGGGEAEVVRIVGAGQTSASITLSQGVVLEASSPGAWGKKLRARVDYDTTPAGADLYNLTVRDVATGARERFLVAADPASPLRLDRVLATSALVRSKSAVWDKRPDAHADVPAGEDPLGDPEVDPPRFATATGGDDTAITDGDYTGSEAAKTGLHQLLKTDIFNILCVLPAALDGDVSKAVLTTALQIAGDRRAMLIVDPPQGWTTLDAAVTGAADPPVSGSDAKNAAIYFPRVMLQAEGALRAFPPSGMLAGVWARTDAERHVWKAPAGIDASLNGVEQVTVPLTNLEQGRLNPVGVNVLREFPVIGPVVWGARTLRGADLLADQWKYIPVRRTALFIEESLYRGTQWVVFEPNDEPLWSAIRLNVGAFMNSLFRQGAFQGRTPKDAYLVKCDAETNPQNDIDRGIVNIVVGFAPLKPAEFVLIHIEQLAGQLQV
jgi:phage tail sheath protein FI